MDVVAEGNVGGGDAVGDAGVGFAGRLTDRKRTRPFGFFREIWGEEGWELEIVAGYESLDKGLLVNELAPKCGT